jgi:hypothetical protein
MVTRRQAILYGIGGIGAGPYLAWAADPFWVKKPPVEWSEKEIRQILSKSPWAREAEMAFSPDGGGMEGGPGGPPPGGMDGPPPGGVGGPGGPGGPMGDMQVIVRWETAAPIRAARKQSATPADPDSYVISVSGMPFGGPEGVRDQMIARVRETAELRRKGKPALKPASVRMEEGKEDPAILFTFPRTANAIDLDDKEVVFTAKMGPFEIKAKFSPKEMQFDGRLSL